MLQETSKSASLEKWDFEESHTPLRGMGVPPPGWNKFPTFPKSKIGGLPFDRILDRISRSRLKNDKVSSPKIASVMQPD